MVGVFFFFKKHLDLTRINEPITILGDVQIGGPVSVVAEILLIALGFREYGHGRSHDHGDGHGDHGGTTGGLLARLKSAVFIVDGHSHTNSGEDAIPTHIEP